MINIGDTIDNRYIVLEVLGTGGMAVVFECRDLISGKIVALKIMKEELVSDKEAIRNFTNEVRSSISMSHPNILEIFGEGNFQNRPYIVIEYLKNQTLFEKIEYLGKYSVKEGCQIMIQLLDAISYTHSHNIIHCDIKPQNIFYMPNGTIKLADFGIASKVNENNRNDKIFGSVHYLAPEIFQGKPYSISSDIYAAGITFFHILTGKIPFDGKSDEIALMHVKGHLPKPSSFNQLIPKEIDDIFMKSTCKNTKNRYKNADEFKKDIEDFLNNKVHKKTLLERIFG